MQLKLTIVGNAAQLASVLTFIGAAGDPGSIAAAPIINNEDDDGLHPAFNLVPEVPAPAQLAEQLLTNHAAQVAAPVVSTAAPSVDADGMPWDKRIHADSKNFNADGTWRKKRKLEPAFIASVEAELRGVVQPAVPPMPNINAEGEQLAEQPQVQVQPVVQPQVQVQPVVQPQVAVQPQMQPVVQQPVAQVQVQPVVQHQPAAVPDQIDMPTFMAHIGPKMAQPDPVNGGMLINPDYLARVTAEIATAFNTPLNVITDIAPQPAMIKYAADCLARDGKW